MKYYIQNKDKGSIGNSLVFWGKNRSGYTSNLDKAGKYPLEEAREICENNPHKNRAWPAHYIDQNEGTARMTDNQFLDKSQVLNFGDL